MQATTTSPSEAGGGYATRRGHVPQLSISDPSHHVTEAIGHMYDDDYDAKRMSYVSSPLSESITTIPLHTAGARSPTSALSSQVHADSNERRHHRPTDEQVRPTPVSSKSYDLDDRPAPSMHRSPSDTANASFPLNDIDYESNPAAVAQELSNLAAIRRMSMDVAAAGDPDLPSFGRNFTIPSLPPSPSADEDDASRLFWVPARLHPELAPKEFKSFLESKAEQIKRKSGDFSSLGPDRQGSSGGGLRRKKSMLSKQIDNPNGYMDGAERLERKRSQSNRDALSPNLHDLEALVDDSRQLNQDAASLLQGIQSLALSSDEDKPILPPAPPGHSLRRSTRTQYRRGSLKKGENLPYSKRLARASDAKDEPSGSPSAGSDDQPILGLTRVSTDPTPNGSYSRHAARTTRGTAYPAGSTPSSTFDAILDHSATPGDAKATHTSQQVQPGPRTSSKQASEPPAARQWHSRISSNGRSTLQIPPSEQKVPEIIETPPEGSPSSSSINTQQSDRSGRDAQYQSQPAVLPKPRKTSLKTSPQNRQATANNGTTLNEFASTPQPLPGTTTRTDSLSFIPTLTEDKKAESKKSKDKKDGEGSRKSSWHWLLGTEEKEKEKKKEREREREREKESESKKTRPKGGVDRAHDSTRLDLLQSSIDSAQRGRESLVLDRLDPKLEEERRKDSVRRASGESKKEKDSGLFSSIFGGNRKRHGGDGHHKKSFSRTLSPDPPARELRPDVDYPWTRFSILEERAIYRMAHIKLANPRRALYSQVLLSNFMYSYLAKVQQMHPHMMVSSSSNSQRQQPQQQQQQQPPPQQKVKDHPEEYLQYQRYQASQEQPYEDHGYGDSHMYDYVQDDHGSRNSTSSSHDNGSVYGPGHYQQYDHLSFGDKAQLDNDDDDMW